MSDNLDQLQPDFLTKLQNFWQANSKKILIAIGAFVVIGGGFYAYKWYSKGQDVKAQEVMFKAEEFFRTDSFNLALNGNGKDKGFLYVVKNHGGTVTGNLAKGYAGICYLQLKDFKKAVEFLKDFSSESPAIQMVAYGSLANAYSELGQKEEAINYYKKAAKTYEVDDLTGGEYLWMAGQLYETMNKNKEAAEMYKEVKEKFPKYKQGEIDKYLFKVSIEKNDLSVN
jgi:tetratricopeptide (TPR) repeat protein